MDVIITAGGTPLPDDPLYKYSHGIPKAMLDVGGKPMIQWVIDAASRSTRVEHIVVIGLRELGSMTCPKPLTLLPDQGTMLGNIRSGIESVLKFNPSTSKVILTASDLPGITTPMVEWMIDQVENTDADIYYNVIRREVMEERYPTSRRTYLKLKDGEYCGGDFNALRADLSLVDNPVWKVLIDQRKNPIKQSLTIGLDTMILVLSRQVSLARVVELFCRRVKIRGHAIQCPFAEMGMDVDKPHQLELMRTEAARSKT